MPLRRNSQDELIAMKKEIFDKYLTRQIKSKDGAGLLKMHPKSFFRLLARYQQYGLAALAPKKTGPKSGLALNRTSTWIEDLVIKIAFDHRNLGPISIAELLAESQSIKLNQTTVYRILKRRKARYFKDYPKIERQRPKLYCLDLPGEELQLDASFPFGRSRKIACFSALDDCARYGFSKCYSWETTDNAIKFVNELIQKAPFNIKSIRIDNKLKKSFRAYCEKDLGIKVIVNDPYMPQQNGKVERFHKTLKHDFFWRQVGFHDTIEEINYQLSFWLNHYNYERRHGGYGMNWLTPAQKIAQTLLYSTTNHLIINPQMVTLTMQQYKN
jgi:transposase InsO family protein